ncbi:MAG: hypothetical protein V4850_01115 [Myxococcota bacterium]
MSDSGSGEIVTGQTRRYDPDTDRDGELDLLVGADGAGPDEQGRAYLLLAP